VTDEQDRSESRERPVRISRRAFCRDLAAGAVAAALAPVPAAAGPPPYRFRYILASSLYGKLKLAEVLPEVRKTGAEHIDIWPRGHADHREQMEAMGHEAFAALLRKHDVGLGILTHYDLGPFRLQKEMMVAKAFGTPLIICGGSGPRGLEGQALKDAVRAFCEKMKPHLAVAERTGVVIGIENHGNNLIESPDSIKWLAELAPSERLGVALAPYHLPQDPKLIAGLIDALGDRLVHFYAWEHGMGCHKKRPKAQELMQMPGRGKLDCVPIVRALRRSRYAGWVSIFMHPVPRGIPILPTAEAVTAEVNRARAYLEACLAKA
jgi:sugar phosphate isomerase/epimerase